MLLFGALHAVLFLAALLVFRTTEYLLLLFAAFLLFGISINRNSYVCVLIAKFQSLSFLTWKAKVVQHASLLLIYLFSIIMDVQYFAMISQGNFVELIGEFESFKVLSNSLQVSYFTDVIDNLSYLSLFRDAESGDLDEQINWLTDIVCFLILILSTITNWLGFLQSFLLQ
jgi:hypothetical protein